MRVLGDPAILDAKDTRSGAVLEFHNLFLRRAICQPLLGTSVWAHTLSFESRGERGTAVAAKRIAGGFLDLWRICRDKTQDLADALEQRHRVRL